MYFTHEPERPGSDLVHDQIELGQLLDGEQGDLAAIGPLGIP
jgi:hypothetical protein